MGHWKNFEELEENISLPELNQILDSSREAERRRQKFAAALKGIDLDKEDTNTSFEQVKKRAEAKLRGMSEEQYEFEEIGVAIEEI